MDRQDFMDIVYSELHSDGDNNRANRIIDAADEYAESANATDKNVGTIVSRQKAIDVLKELTANGTNKGMISGEDAVHRIEMLPPVTPKQRTGYWYPVGMAEAVGGESAQWGSEIAYHKCSECDEQALCEFGQEVLSKWCPHCGAKMEGVSE